MSLNKPTVPKGTRDFGPEKMLRRQYILDIIRRVFEKYGYQPLETPAMENLSVLTGKYGDEGDQLLFKILNSGNFLSKSTESDYRAGCTKLLPFVAEKGLRYDLTVPFARFVVMNQNDIAFPFKRYQIQPVWRADRPQKGRYREFYQCDADIVGSDSLVSEAEFMCMIIEVMQSLRIADYTISINNRKLLSAMAAFVGEKGRESELCIAIDKLDKIGRTKVEEELAKTGFTEESIEKLGPVFELRGENAEKIEQLDMLLEGSAEGMRGIAELKKVFEYTQMLAPDQKHITFDLTLARGLSYYTGTIFEVKVNNSEIKSSITGGGRYDDLTGVFGLKGVSGAGFSFGVDRIYDVMEDLQLFPSEFESTTKVLLLNFGEELLSHTLETLRQLRSQQIRCEIYPEAVKIKKQMTYANKKRVPYVLILGENERTAGKYLLKNMSSGEQNAWTLEELMTHLRG